MEFDVGVFIDWKIFDNLKGVKNLLSRWLRN